MGSMKRIPSLIVGLLTVVLGASAQRQVDPSIIVAGIIEAKRITVTAADIGKLPKQTVKVKTTTGVAAFEGVALRDVLALTGVLFGQKLHGARLMVFVVVEGAPPPLGTQFNQENGDTYRALFSLPELDPTFSDGPPAILAITQDGKPLNREDGPYRLVVPEDKRQSRWVKDVKMIWVLHADHSLPFGAIR
jgi:hypothetical protein